MTNKDFVINLRVSRDTYEKIRRKAKENSQSISNLVRKAIEDSGEIIRDISRDLKGEKEFEDVVGYHKSQAARDAKCDRCGETIKKGETLVVGETEGARKYFFCTSCA